MPKPPENPAEAAKRRLTLGEIAEGVPQVLAAPGQDGSNSAAAHGFALKSMML